MNNAEKIYWYKINVIMKLGIIIKKKHDTNETGQDIVYS